MANAPRRPRARSRREFLGAAAPILPTLALPLPRLLGAAAPRGEQAADLVVLGGGLGGCAAALAALRRDRRVILTEETAWIGGQLTAQGVPPDEHPWIEAFGCTRAYRQLRDQIRERYRRSYPLTPAARARADLNPGNGWVSRLCHEPAAALAVLEEWLAPYLSSGRLTLLRGFRPVRADVAGDRVEAVTVQSRRSGRELSLAAPYFADATELGDLLPLTGTEYRTGAEGRDETGEPHAAAVAQPRNMQAFTCCFAIDYIDGEDHTIERPASYDFWRSYVPALSPPWPGPLLSLTATHPVTLAPRTFEFDPRAGSGLWAYRRIADRAAFLPGAYAGDISLINWPQNDYLLGNLCEVSAAEAAGHLAQAKQLSLSLLYWLQTEAPRPDGGTGWKGLRLRGDLLGGEDGLAQYPYVREARRIRAEFTVLEQHVGTDARAAELGVPGVDAVAAPFPDSVGIGSYRIDLHPSTGGDNYIDISSLPFQVPLGALLPVRVDNLLPSCKNLGVTHITNGCYRLHPVEWNIGEAVGELVHFCLARGEPPRAVRARQALLADYQRALTESGIELEWPRLRPR